MKYHVCIFTRSLRKIPILAKIGNFTWRPMYTAICHRDWSLYVRQPCVLLAEIADDLNISNERANISPFMRYRLWSIAIRLLRCIEFYIHSSVHRNSIVIRSNNIQQYAGIYLLRNRSTCFGCPLHPSLGVYTIRKTVTAASGTGHSIWATTFLKRGQMLSRWRKVVAQILWPVPEATVTVLCTPDDGFNGHPKHVEWFCNK